MPQRRISTVAHTDLKKRRRLSQVHARSRLHTRNHEQLGLSSQLDLKRITRCRHSKGQRSSEINGMQLEPHLGDPTRHHRARMGSHLSQRVTAGQTGYQSEKPQSQRKDLYSERDQESCDQESTSQRNPWNSSETRQDAQRALTPDGESAWEAPQTATSAEIVSRTD